jgi:tRNA (mo5U34)-methyltransferase
MDYLEYLPKASFDAIRRLRQEKSDWISQAKKGFLRYRNPYEVVKHLRALHCDFSGSIVKIGTKDDISADERNMVHESMRAFMPWRKGPFSVFGIEIDAEWRSERKWERLLPRLPSLEGKIVADIGCNNGYYMFRMAHYNPFLVLGFEPFVQHYYAFSTLNSFAAQNNLAIELFGVEHLPLFPECFDVIFLLGIIYHRASPVDTLRDIYCALKPGATLLIESQAIPGDAPLALFPQKTYAKVPGTWFVPTGRCLVNWLERTGFKDIELFCSHAMSSLEQRRTEWMTYESYEDFIDKEHPELTIEKYPAPWRVFLKAHRY